MSDHSPQDWEPDWSDTRTFFLAPDRWHEPYILQGDDVHHLRVLRLKPGDEVRMLDGQGREGAFRLVSCGKREATLTLIREWTHPRPTSGVILAAGWTKAARRSFLLEKAVELGAAGVWFWQAERSQFPVPDDVKDTWSAQLVAGLKQCRNPWLPSLRTLSGGLVELVHAADSLNVSVRHVLLEDTLKPSRALTPELLAAPGLTLCVLGPEGGFSPREAQFLQAQHFLPLTLGRRVLRWETAALLCLGLHWWRSETQEC